MTPVERVLDRLPGRVRKSGRGRWMACCPAHPDRTPSLSIHEADDGKALLHCFSGCTTESVLRELGLGFKDLFGGAL